MTTSTYVDEAGRVIVGRLHSNQQLNKDIAQHLLSSLRSGKKLIPSARNSQHGWYSVLESIDGVPVLFSSEFSDKETAHAMATEAAALLTK